MAIIRAAIIKEATAEEATIKEVTTREATVEAATTAHTHKVEGTTPTVARNQAIQDALRHAVLLALLLLAAVAFVTY